MSDSGSLLAGVILLLFSQGTKERLTDTDSTRKGLSLAYGIRQTVLALSWYAGGMSLPEYVEWLTT